MNRDRRTRLAKISAKLEELQQELESVKDEKQGAFDNMPESLQGSEKGEAMEHAVSELDCFSDDLTGLIDKIAELIC
ncbi:hypothetical protein [Rhodoferax sp.]|uniref:hypothetical protein n=1 Tax=Rhodoferax sp. TaxID=50421 RepID=UPI002ACEE652|nr:hypothetical protein [Rhodoferax sp.]MDZ7920662.1 hypothetical protein [Rhodoferax sp.]